MPANNANEFEVETFEPAPGTPVVDAMRQFYAGQTSVRSPFASLIFSTAFLERVVSDVQDGLQRATQFRTKRPKVVRGWDTGRPSGIVPADPQIPFPWRHLLAILVHVAASDPREHRLFQPEDVRVRIMYLCHEHLLSARRLLSHRLKTKALLHRDRHIAFFAPTAEDGAEFVGVSADARALRFDSELASRRDLGEVDVMARTRGDGTMMRAQLDAVYHRHPTMAPHGFGTGTVHKLDASASC